MEENKNYKAFIVPIVAVAIFTLLVFGAGYAWFAATITTSNVTNINATLPTQNTTFYSTSSTCGINVSAAGMVKAQAGSYSVNNTCTLNVTLTGAQGVNCTYDVALNAVGTAYAPSASLGSNKEFTGTLYNGTINTSNLAQNRVVDETQMNTLAPTPTNSGVLLNDQAIQVPSGGTITTVYTFNEKWYNIDLDQGSHSGKTYQYQLKVEDVKC